LATSSITIGAGTYGYNSAAGAANIATQINNLLYDVTVVKRVLNAVIDDLQANGIFS
jgi:hypothetical protein